MLKNSTWRFGRHIWQHYAKRGYTHAQPRTANKTKLVGATTAGLLVSWMGWEALKSQWANDARLSPNRYVPLELVEKEQLNYNTFRLRLATQPQPEMFPALSCLYIKDDAIQVMRAYTPVNPDPFKDGYVDLLIKRYDNGSVSRTLTNFALHDHVHVRGPMIEYEYKENTKEEIGMIAGGTGITPMYQLIRRILENPNDNTRLWLIYGNKGEQDILLRKELDMLQRNFKDRFTVHYVLEHPPAGWTGGQGFVSESTVRKFLGDKEKTLVFVCGPDKMLAHVCGQRARDFSQGKVTGVLGSLGLTSAEVFKLE
ncbi:hypothetical protein DFQ28_003708 [Apophysomyces sp. BC1034]|nr:hypothetical protein DFQ30_003728 [Apophysomyces sp. BC1015]KAG0178906.1 hypothetical protein DFQ29_002861 [Apophysomyces sp. BC1021]KAG0189215.1 hypothetical protein DFQ28_003708 [Apophysomyces sp. BC1034]